MKKYFRLISALLAACMSLTMVAGAANIAEDEPEMETFIGVAHVFEVDGSYTKKEFEYTAPADATADEKTDIAAETAERMLGLNTARATRNTIANQRNVEIPKKTSDLSTCKIVPDSLLEWEGGTIEVRIYDVEDCSTLNVSLVNRNQGRNKFWQADIDVEPDRTDVVFYHQERYPDSMLWLNEDDEITTYISGDVAGSAYRVRVYHTH